MKKLISIILTVILVFSIGATAFASERPSTVVLPDGRIAETVPGTYSANTATPDNPLMRSSYQMTGSGVEVVRWLSEGTYVYFGDGYVTTNAPSHWARAELHNTRGTHAGVRTWGWGTAWATSNGSLGLSGTPRIFWGL